jgi:hypothetical protein
MTYKWMFILGFIAGALLFLFTMQCLEWADNQQDNMTVYEQMIRGNPTAAGKK